MHKPSDALAKHNSDKSVYHTGYLPVYDNLFEPIQESATAILEIGVLEGCSVRAWRDCFPNAVIYGIDNDPARLVNESRIVSFRGDTTERYAFLDLCTMLPMMDVIIDDASHVIMEQLWAVAALWRKLKPGGLFIVEDIQNMTYANLFWCFPNAVIHDLRCDTGQPDSIMAVMRK